MTLFLSSSETDMKEDYSQVQDEILYFPVYLDGNLYFNEIGAFCFDSVCMLKYLPFLLHIHIHFITYFTY